jgi:hypothetical protein
MTSYLGDQVSWCKSKVPLQLWRVRQERREVLSGRGVRREKQ